MKVLIAIDNSFQSETVIRVLGERPWWGDTKFRLITVTPVQARTNLKKVNELATLLRKLVTKSLPVETKLVETQDRISRVILEEACDWHSDLIVLGSHEYNNLQRFFLGNVAQEVLQSAPCSVEIIKTQSAVEIITKALKSRKKQRRKEDLASTVY